MKSITVDRPDWIPEDIWELDGFTFDVDDALPPAVREKISRKANALAIKATRLSEAGQSVYEDDGASALLADLWTLCLPAILGVHSSGKELPPSGRQEVLETMNILSRDSLANEVVGLNQLGIKKK